MRRLECRVRVEKWEGGEVARLENELSGAWLPLDNPVQLGGEPGTWSPPDLVAGAYAGCLALTAWKIADKLGLEPVKLEVESTLTWDLLETKLVKAEAKLILHCRRVDEARARKLPSLVERNCLVAILLAAAGVESSINLELLEASSEG